MKEKERERKREGEREEKGGGRATQTTQGVSSFEDFTFREDYKETQLNGGWGLITNVPDIDKLTEGITSGKIVAVIAPPKSFKTTFAINMCYINLLKPGNNSLFITLEMSAYELYFKILVRHAYKIKKKLPIPAYREKFMCKMDKIFHKDMKSKLLIIENQDIKLSTLSKFKYKLKKLIEDHDLKTIYIDCIQLFSTFQPKGFRDKYEFLNELVNTMREVSITHNCRFIILSQLTKEGVENAIRTEGIMCPTDINISALIEQCSYMISLFSNDALKGSQLLQTQLLYHRDGETYADPKLTFVIPQYYVVGDIDLSVYQTIKERIMKLFKGKSVNTIDLFK